MCFGIFSSAIRRSREKLPPLPDIYDLAFVEQIAGFFPHLTDMKFLGGEPMLIELYHRLWAKAAELKPDLFIHITTSAAVLPAAVRKMLERINAGFIVSLDSLDPGNYEAIRRNAKLGETLENIRWLIDLSRRKGTFASLAVCPITCNWREIPELVRFANRNGMSIVFNTVWGPERLSLRYLDDCDLARLLDLYTMVELPCDTPLQASNRLVFEEFVGMCRHWYDAARDRGNHLTRFYLPILLAEAIQRFESGEGLAREIATICRNGAQVSTGFDLEASQKSCELVTMNLLELAAQKGYREFGHSYLRVLQIVREVAKGTDRDFELKISIVAKDLSSISDPGTYISTLVQIGILMGVEMIESSDKHLLISGLLDA